MKTTQIVGAILIMIGFVIVKTESQKKLVSQEEDPKSNQADSTNELSKEKKD